jgi:hypothetical protein
MMHDVSDALGKAAANGRTATVTELVRLGADPNAQAITPIASSKTVGTMGVSPPPPPPPPLVPRVARHTTRMAVGSGAFRMALAIDTACMHGC